VISVFSEKAFWNLLFRMFAFSSDCQWSTPLDLKAAGPDNIMPRVPKELAMEISPILTLIFSKSYVRRSSIYMAYSTCMSNIQKGEEICQMP
jgi:hypothetical protein